VLCDIAVKDGGPVWDQTIFSYDSEPPKKIKNYLGLSKDNILDLINMNDDEGKSFEEIADEIEFNIMPSALRNVA
jgi:hypothetical protein